MLLFFWSFFFLLLSFLPAFFGSFFFVPCDQPSSTQVKKEEKERISGTLENGHKKREERQREVYSIFSEENTRTRALKYVCTRPNVHGYLCFGLSLAQIVLVQRALFFDDIVHVFLLFFERCSLANFCESRWRCWSLWKQSRDDANFHGRWAVRPSDSYCR